MNGSNEEIKGNDGLAPAYLGYTLEQLEQEGKLSPMMRHYFQVKEQYPGHILFYRLGDFYEMFFDDAVNVSKALGLTLTGRDCGLQRRAPMCGVPHHACDTYIKKLVDNGFSIAICEQTADPATCKGMVPREVLRVITPGTLIESSMLDDSVNNFLCSIYMSADAGVCAAAFADISTGEVHLFSFSDKDMLERLYNELSRFEPSEILLNSAADDCATLKDFISLRIGSCVRVLTDDDFSIFKHIDEISAQTTKETFEALRVQLENESCAESALCGLFTYVFRTQKKLAGRFSDVQVHIDDPMMTIGYSARRNLELVETLRSKDKKGSLLWVLDNTRTSMGRRMLRSYIEQPLVNPSRIMERLDAVEQLTESPVELSEIKEILGGVYDLERLMTRVMYKSASPRDLRSLSVTAEKLPALKEMLEGFSAKLLKSCNERISTLDEINNLIGNAIVDEPPVSVKDGGVIRDGFNEQLDSLRKIRSGGKQIIEDIAERERESTGIKNLKVGYNRVFGYYLEVTKSYYDLVPETYIRKQTLANCERFITEELKNAENTILGASDKIITLEQEIFSEIIDFASTQIKTVSQTASAVAQIDVLCSFAAAALNNNYCKPDLTMDGSIEIKKGRHPVVELMQKNEVFVPNDTYLDLTANRMAIVTGPNMSGKSTYMRQIALICLMAQIGSFVPAEYARLSVVDQIYTRIGASDDLTAGQSTFMVEMSEVADIVKHATKNSLVILDEVGRGTSTFDGISIARSVAEYILNSKKLGCKTLFATHYHELISLESEMEGVVNYSVSVRKQGGNIRFLRKIVRGGADQSYGIEVAKLAGLPKKIITRADELLEELERANREKLAEEADRDDVQVSFDRITDSMIVDKLRKTNIDELDDTELREFIKEIVKYI